MGDAQSRGWGSPPTPRSKIVTIRTGDVLLPVHRGIGDLVKALCDETQRRGYMLVSGWCWGYAPRLVRGSSTTWSNHAWGLAVDLNAPKNPMTSRLVTDMPSWMPRLWEDHGFRWGGRYTTRPDAMHYEFMGTPASAAMQTRRARSLQGGLSVADVDKILSKLAGLDADVAQARRDLAKTADAVADVQAELVKAQRDRGAMERRFGAELDELRRQARRQLAVLRYPKFEGQHTIVEDGVDVDALPLAELLDRVDRVERMVRDATQPQPASTPAVDGGS